MASSRSLGTLTLDLLIKTGSFVTGLDKAERTAKQKLSSMERAAFSFGKTFGVAFAAAGTAALAGLSSLTKAAIDNADSLRDLSIRIGVSTETLSGYGYAASQTGTDIESLSTGLKILAKNAAAALDPTSQQAKIFDALGISVKDAQGNLRDLDELVPEIATKFKVLEDGTTKAALSQQLFGKSGLELVEFFNLGGQGLADLTAKFRALGGEIDQKTADAADNFKDTLGDVKVITSALGLSIARELLPTLQEGADDLKRMAIQGDLAANAATVLGAAVRGVVGLLDAYNNAVNRVSIAMEFAAETGGSFARVLGSIASGGGLAALPGAIGKITDSYKDAQAQLDSLSKSHEQFVVNFAGEGPDPAGLFRRSPEEVDALKQVNSLQEKLTKAMAGGEKASRSRKTAISEEEKEAKRLLQAYEQLTENYAEQIALFGKEGEAARVRYDIEFGALKGLNEAQKESLLLQAERLDTMRDEKEVAEELARIEERRQENVAAVLEDLQFETDALGKTVEQQEKMNLLRYAGVDANSAYGQSILDAADKYQELRKVTEDQIELMDSVRDSARGFFDDLYDGVGVVDALKNAFGDLADQIFKWATNGLIEKFFGQMGSTSGGSGGGWLSALFGSTGGSQGSIMDLFSGAWGYADGGYTGPGHRLQVAGVVHAGEYVMDANATRRIGVDALDRLSAGAPIRGGGNITNIYVQPTSTRRTADQVAQAYERKQRTASLRNR